MSTPYAILIDDDANNLEVLAQLLHRAGLASQPVLKVADLSGVLQGLRTAPAVIFLDLEMPGANGYDVLTALKADGRFVQTPIIACTVHTNEIHTAYEFGFSGFIPKPLDSLRFPDQLARILNGESVWEQA